MPEHTPEAPAPLLIEGYAKLILRTIFATGVVSLLCLLPKGNGKTAIMAGLAVFHMLTVPAPRVFIAAADVEQAKEMFGFAQHYCESEPEIARLVVITESTRIIRLRKRKGRAGGYIKILASDKTKSQGKKHSYSPTLALIDELHAHENLAVFGALRQAMFKGKRRGVPGMETSGIMGIISTAGHNVNSVLGLIRADYLTCEERGGTIRRGLVVNGEGNPEQGDGRLNIATTANGANVMLEWACRGENDPGGPADDLEDMVVVKLANPASFVTPKSLEDVRTAPGVTPWDFARYRANVWTLAFRSWIPVPSWDLLREGGLRVGRISGAPVAWRTWERATVDELRDHIGELFPWGSRLYGAVDMARYRDCAAVAMVHPREGRPKAVRGLVWRSGGPDNPIPYGPVMDALRALHAVYDVQAIGWDPKYFDQPAETLTNEGLRMVKFDQSPERMCPAAADARTEIIGGDDVPIETTWAHDGDPILKAHVLAGSARDVGPGQFRVDKAEESGPPIDLCIASLMAAALERTIGPDDFWVVAA